MQISDGHRTWGSYRATSGVIIDLHHLSHIKVAGDTPDAVDIPDAARSTGPTSRVSFIAVSGTYWIFSIIEGVSRLASAGYNRVEPRG